MSGPEYGKRICDFGAAGVRAETRAPLTCPGCGLTVRPEPKDGRWVVRPHHTQPRDVVEEQRNDGQERYRIRLKKERGTKK